MLISSPGPLHHQHHAPYDHDRSLGDASITPLAYAKLSVVVVAVMIELARYVTISTASLSDLGPLTFDIDGAGGK